MAINYRQFSNPLGLTSGRIWDRLYPLDAGVEVKIENALVSIASSLSDAVIEEALSDVSQPEPAKSRNDVAAALLISSGLAGRNLTTVNNNTDRDNLTKVICYMLGIADASGVILSPPQPQIPKK